MENPESNATTLSPEEIKKAISDKILKREQEINRTNFRAALAGEIMATLSAAAYTALTLGERRPVNWYIIASEAIDAADALIAKLEEK